MKLVVLFLSLLVIVSCDSTKEEKKVALASEVVEVSDTSDREQIIIDSVSIEKVFQPYQIGDYYVHFFGSTVAALKENTREEAFKNKTFLLNKIDYKNGYISFITQNTPLDIDGDSELEIGYEITYWNQSDSSKIIAVNKTEYTWVSEQSEVTFYLHDKNGINEFNPLQRNWTLNDFTNSNVSTFFPQELIDFPPVFIRLPQKGKDIKVYLALQEYYEPEEYFIRFDSLNLVVNGLEVNPTEGNFVKVEVH